MFGTLACIVILHVFKDFLKGIFLENPLQNWNGVTDFSQERLKRIIEYVSYSIR